MAQPLSPLPSASLNTRTTSTPQFNTEDSISTKTELVHMEESSYRETGTLDDPSSSPFLPTPRVEDKKHDQRINSPAKHSFASGPELASLEMNNHEETIEDGETIYHDPEENYNMGSSTTSGRAGYDGMDDTAFSTFSAVPNMDMTRFAHNGQFQEGDRRSSPSKQLQAESKYSLYHDTTMTPSQQSVAPTPRTARQYQEGSPSPTPRRRRERARVDDTSSLLLDFTEQFNAYATNTHSISPSKYSRRSPSKSQTQPDLASFVSRGRTPSPNKRIHGSGPTSDSRHLANLLDFDIPPAPTPRSIPSITAREVESMKSNYLSQISSLKATLSGKTAEVNSLKEAVGDAERRVGEALENLRDERGARESMQADKDDWEKRGKEMENVLRSVKQEIMREEREKDSLSSRLEECERKREEAETRIAEAESRTAGLLAASESNASMNHGDSADNSRNSSKDVEAAVEKVARELHALYKSKHETKVSALKKSYEARWEKKVKELEAKLEDTSREIEELRIGRDSTMSGVVPRLPSAMDVEQQQERAELVQQAEEQKAKLLGLASEVASIKKDNFQLRNDLEKERNEKGDLVGAVEELLMIQAAAQAGDPVASNGLENLRGSISRASGLRGPGFTSRMPGPNLTATPSNGRSEHHLTQTNSTGSTGRSHSRGNSGIGGARSGIMSNIERMGRGRGD